MVTKNPLTGFISKGITFPKLAKIPGIRSPKGWGKITSGVRSEYRDQFGAPQGWWLKQVPDGTQPEYSIYRALQSLGLKANVDFVFRATIKGAHVNFVIPALGIALILQGQSSAVTPTQQQNDALAQATLQSAGYKTVFISDQSAVINPIDTTRQALSGK